MKKSSKSRTIVIVLFFSALFLLIAVYYGSILVGVSIAENAIGQLLSPAMSFVHNVTSQIIEFFNDFREQREALERYEVLQRRFSQLEQELIYLNELELENERLTGLLNFAQQNERFAISGGRVIGKDPGNWFNTFMIDIGSNSEIEVDMAVVNESGLLGRVVEVGSNWARVISIIDGRSTLSGMIERTRDNGLIRGNNRFEFEDGLLRMIYLPLDTDIVIGDKVLTSGLDGVFPKGIFIGLVTDILGREHELYVSAVITPAADFKRLEEILVIKTDQPDIDS